MPRDAYLDHLTTVPMFSALAKRDLQKIAKASDEVTIEEGRAVVQEGTIGHEAFVILEGKATVERKGLKVADLGPGDHFGELALLDGGPRTATVIATTPLTVLVLGQREFAGVLDSIPGIAHKLLATLATRIRELDEKAYG
jgi:CRP/FNR family transcriptional regulator, cyclic AMP receptor protein